MDGRGSTGGLQVFTAATGLSPLRYQQALRVEKVELRRLTARPAPVGVPPAHARPTG